MNGIIKDELKEIAEIILEQTHKLLDYENGAPQIEVDIVKDNIRKLYDNIDVLLDVNMKNSSSAKNTIEVSIDEQVDDLLNIAEAEFQDNIKELAQQMGEITDEQYDTKEEAIEIESILSEEEKGGSSVDKNSLKVETPIATPQEKPQKEQIVESTQTELHSIGDQLQRKPIKSLKTSIGINDKFQFINELFDGSMKVYNQAMEQMEQSKDQKSAIDNFRSIATTGKWDEENQAYIQLLDYVERRFL